jgi:ribosomal protein L31
MQDSYTFSFPSFIKGEFLTKLKRVNKKLAGMAEANQVQILGETLESRKILKPEPRKRVKETSHLKVGHGRYVPSPEDYMDVVFSVVQVSLPIQTKINGFELAGTINIEGDVKTIHSLNDEVNLANVDVKVCHHCNVRRKRNRLHVFTEVQTGNHVAIGSTCTHEYLGLDVDGILHTFFNFYKEEDLYGSRGMGEAWGFPIVNLANACRVAYSHNPTYVKSCVENEYGSRWNRFSTNENGTKWVVDGIHAIMYGGSLQPDDIAHKEKLFNELATLPKVGNLLKETYEGLDAKSSNFNSNIVETLFYTDDEGTKTLRDFIVGKARGMFVWCVFNALKKSEEVKAKAALPKEKDSFHVGEVGERVQVSGVVKFIKDMHNDFGSSRLVVVKGQGGEEVKTFTTSKGCWDLEVGSSVSIKGTVSKHEDFKGTKSTMVKRANFS